MHAAEPEIKEGGAARTWSLVAMVKFEHALHAQYMQSCLYIPLSELSKLDTYLLSPANSETILSKHLKDVNV